MNMFFPLLALRQPRIATQSLEGEGKGEGAIKTNALKAAYRNEEKSAGTICVNSR